MYQVMGWMNDFVGGDKFVAGTSQMTIADISLLATYSTIKVHFNRNNEYKRDKV